MNYILGAVSAGASSEKHSYVVDDNDSKEYLVSDVGNAANPPASHTSQLTSLKKCIRKTELILMKEMR